MQRVVHGHERILGGFNVVVVPTDKWNQPPLRSSLPIWSTRHFPSLPSQRPRQAATSVFKAQLVQKIYLNT